MQATVEDASDEDEVPKPATLDTPDLKTPRPSVSQPGDIGGVGMDGVLEDLHEEPATPITAVPVEVDDESDDGYSGWMDDETLEVDMPPPISAAEEK
jgi:hypothetical protein